MNNQITSLVFIVIIISQCHKSIATDSMSFYGYTTIREDDYELMYVINPTSIILLGKRYTSDGYETFKAETKFSSITLEKGYLYPKYYVNVYDAYLTSSTWWKPSNYQIEYTYSSCNLYSKEYSITSLSSYCYSAYSYFTNIIQSYFTLYESFYIIGESDVSFKSSFSILISTQYFLIQSESSLKDVMNSFVDDISSGSYYSTGDYYYINMLDEIIVYYEDYAIIVSSLDEEIYFYPSTSVEIYDDYGLFDYSTEVVKCSKTSSSSTKGVCSVSSEAYPAEVLTQSEVIDKITKVLEQLMIKISTKIENAVDSSTSSSKSNRMRELYSTDNINNTNSHNLIRNLDYTFGCYYESVSSSSSSGSYSGRFVDSNRVVIVVKKAHGCTSSSFKCLMQVRQVYDVSNVEYDSYSSSSSNTYTLTLTSINKKLSGLEFSQYDVDYYRSYYKCNVYQKFYTYGEISDLCSEIRDFALDLFDSYMYNSVNVVVLSNSCSSSGLSIYSGKKATSDEINRLVSMITIVSYPITSGIVAKNVLSDQVAWDLNGKTVTVNYLDGSTFASYSIYTSSSSSLVQYSNYTMIGSYYYFTIPGNDKVCKSSTTPFLFLYSNLPCSDKSQSGNRLKREIMNYMSLTYGNVINLIKSGVVNYNLLEEYDDNTYDDNISVTVNPLNILLFLIILMLI